MTLSLLTSIVSLHAQTKVVPDSMQCFSPQETRKVAITILQNKECQSLLAVTNKQLGIKMELLADDDAQLILLNKVSKDKDLIIDNKNKELTEQGKLLKKEIRHKKMWKFLTVTSTVVFGVLLVIVAVK